MELYQTLKLDYPSEDKIKRLLNAMEVRYYELPPDLGDVVRHPISDEWIPAIPKDMIQAGYYQYLLCKAETAILEKRMRLNVGKLISPEGKPDRGWYFVTINFDDNIVTDDVETLAFNTSVRKIYNTPIFSNVRFVCEKFRKEEGIHRHIHMLVDSSAPKSRVIQQVFQKVKKYCGSDRFIDVKNWTNANREVYEEYIRGNKQSSKMEYVEKDKAWRQQKKIVECDFEKCQVR